MRPHYRRNTAASYVSYYCQNEIAQLFSELSAACTLGYDKNGVSAIEVKSEQGAEPLTIIRDSRDSRAVFDVDLKTVDSEPSAIRTFLLERATLSAEPYYLSMPDNDVQSLLTTVMKLNNDIGAEMQARVHYAYSNEPELREKVSYIARLTPRIEAWTKENQQYLVYDGSDQSEARWKLKTFIASYLNVFTLDGTLMLTHSGSAMAFACRNEPSGVAWYAADSFAGYEHEKALGRISKDSHDDLLDQNGMEYLSLKHMFIPENIIAATVNGVLTPLTAKVDQLQLYVSAIAEDLNLLEQLNASPTP